MKQSCAILGAVVLSCVGIAGGQDDVVKKELAKMQGTWCVVRGEEDGQPASDSLIEHLKWTVKGDRLTLKGLKPTEDAAGTLQLSLDVSTMPKCIDLKVLDGSLKGATLEGVYEWKDDEWKMCIHMRSGNRPLEFETKQGTDRVLFVLKRETP
jgi:uncharacterized protein (TIGR03067 family)